MLHIDYYFTDVTCIVVILTLFYFSRENNVKSGGWLIMHHVVALIAERQEGVSLEAATLFLRGRGKSVYILPSSDPTLALLLVGFTEYDDDPNETEVVALVYAIITTRTMGLDWQMRALRVLPIFLFPAFSSAFYWALFSFTRMRDSRDQKIVDRLRAERQEKIDELKERSNYYATQQPIQVHLRAA
ncbi:putative Lunapark family protein [Helianthus anomalus]